MFVSTSTRRHVAQSYLHTLPNDRSVGLSVIFEKLKMRGKV